MDKDLISLFEFEETNVGTVVLAERHYRLVPPESIEACDLDTYRKRSDTEDS